jgi:2-(1,2-epoxy-1,2-dihydrophenyl)acetyl-CoA isomerase
MSQDAVLLEREGAVAILRLNQSERLNPLSLPLQERLRALLGSLAQDRSVRALVLTGAGKAFCVGADLSGMRSPPAGQSLGEQTHETMLRLSNQLIEDLRQMPFPVVSAVNGPCAGAGVGLALAADVVLAARSAYFFLSFMPRLGIVPDLGSTWFLERFVGRPRAVAMSLLGERISGEQAAQWGLVWACVDDAQLHEQAMALAQRLAALPAHAAQEIRGVYDAAAQQDLSAQLRLEAARQRELIDRPEFREGVQAFLEKREPRFAER